jgi:hypothetical protein
MLQPVMFDYFLKCGVLIFTFREGVCVIVVIMSCDLNSRRVRALSKREDSRFYWKIVSSVYSKFFIRKKSEYNTKGLSLMD